MISIQIALDVARDSLNPFPQEPVLILTSNLVPIKLFYTGHGQPHEYLVHSTSLITCDEFGARVQHGLGYMCHGHTKTPVRVPYAGQRIYFFSHLRQQVVSRGHQILRVYPKPLNQLVDNPLLRIRQVVDQLSRQENPVAGPLSLLHSGNSIYVFLDELMELAINRVSSGQTFDGPTSTRIQTVEATICGYSNLGAIFQSGLIAEDHSGRIVLSDALLVLYMEAIHRAKPMSTNFAPNGFLQVIHP